MLEKEEYVLAALLDVYPQGKIEDIAFSTDIDLQKYFHKQALQAFSCACQEFLMKQSADLE